MAKNRVLAKILAILCNLVLIKRPLTGCLN